MLRTLPLVSAAVAAAETFPNAPKSTFTAERFIARHMSSASRKPEVPSSDPVMIWILFISTKPIAASASPPYALRSAITTGMSAAPIGTTSSRPKTSDSATIT